MEKVNYSEKKTGMHLREYRKEAGLTAKEVGDFLGISAHAIYAWEKGRKNPSLQNLCNLAKIYNKSIDEIIEVEKGSDARL